MIHTAHVREVRTVVKGVDYVPAICEDTYMATNQTAGATLLALKTRADLTLDEIAAAAGYKGKSSVQEYFKAEYEGPLGSVVASKLANALEGRGLPPIARDEVLALMGERPTSNATGALRFEGASTRRMAEDLPIYGTALGAEKIIDGEAIEQTTLNRGEIIGYAKRPVILNGKPDVYGLHVQGSSMEPVHADGAFIVVQRAAPLKVNDDIVVYLRPRDESDDGETATQVLVKRLVRRSAQYLELRQYTPETTFRIAMADVLHIDRVLTLADLLS